MAKTTNPQMFEYNLSEAKKNNYIVFTGDLYSSKNNRQTFVNKKGQIINIKSKAALKQEGAFEQQLGLQLYHWKQLTKNYENCYPLELSFEIFRGRAGCFDYINIIQGLADAMVKMGYLEDDSADHLIPYFLPYKIDRVNPRTIIRVMP